jgi:hypothetical protein
LPSLIDVEKIKKPFRILVTWIIRRIADDPEIGVNFKERKAPKELSHSFAAHFEQARKLRSEMRKPSLCEGFPFFGRDDWIRTSGLLHPMQTRYRAALRPETKANFYPLRDALPGCAGSRIPAFGGMQI